MCVSIFKCVWVLEGETAPAVLLKSFGFICAVEELSLEELHGDNSEDEHEEDVDDEDVEHVLQRVHHTVKHRLKTCTHTHAKKKIIHIIHSYNDHMYSCTLECKVFHLP